MLAAVVAWAGKGEVHSIYFNSILDRDNWANKFSHFQHNGNDCKGREIMWHGFYDQMDFHSRIKEPA